MPERKECVYFWYNLNDPTCIVGTAHKTMPDALRMVTSVDGVVVYVDRASIGKFLRDVDCIPLVRVCAVVVSASNTRDARAEMALIQAILQ